MCKSSNLAFVLICAFAFRLEKPRWSLIAVILIITAGVVMMVFTETEFHLVGAVEVLTASAMGGLRWSLTQMLLDKKAMGLDNPVATLRCLAPIMGVLLVIISLAVESWSELFSSKFFETWATGLHTLILIIIPGCLAFCMNIAEYGCVP